ncbi:hypothetical protein PPL_02873 [Heterostelium album PN500]|uniref:Ubiquitin-like domain-containing protein n=1 Tax=Heterostelium pallidum (strain ATCC 26659 / Pp 5 / PN500) TaxID=670386 RepID=D3B3A7_HETP5|nr:hypothetical protein PPL_02873 [Heterostelium album PN500]EFA83805.1 hypothetical protein PPL_02873 [Heterostelium album PN500]|eukprot:XP_020435922.1 hypothetical protein PPL_02873 [Heterostelium album PN500]
MKIFIELPFCGKITILEVENNFTIEKVKLMIQEMENFPMNRQILNFQGNEITDNNQTLSDLNIQNESTINVYLLMTQR